MEGEMGTPMIKDDDDCLKDRTCYPRRGGFRRFRDNYGGGPCLERVTRLNLCLGLGKDAVVGSVEASLGGAVTQQPTHPDPVES